MKAPRPSIILFAALLWLVPSARAHEPSGDKETALRLAADANDYAFSLEERQEALSRLEEAAGLLLRVGETAEATRVLNRAGRLQLMLHAPQDALATHQKALALLKQIPAADVEVDNLNGTAAVYMRLKQFRETENALGKSLRLAEQAGYQPGQAEALLILSDRQNYANHSDALLTAQKALTLWQALDDRRGMARAHSQVGHCYSAKNMLVEAEENYRQALTLWRELGNAPEQAEVLIMLGYIEYRRGEWQSEISLMTQARGMIDERAEPGMMGQIAAGLAEAFQESGVPEASLIHYQRALDYHRQTQNPHSMAYVTWGLGVAHYLLGHHSEAVKYFRQALAGIPSDGPMAAQCYEYLGRVYSDTGDNALALQHLQSALAIFTKTDNPKEAARVRGLLGQIAERQGRPAAARKFYRRALEEFTRLSDEVNQAALHYALGRLELKHGNYDDAEGHLRQALEATEGIRRLATASDLIAAFSATVHERYEKYVECIMRQHAARPGRGLDARAFEVSDSARGRALIESLRTVHTSLLNGLDEELTGEEKALRQALRVKENSKVALLSQDYSQEKLSALESELARLRAEYERVTDTLRERHPAYGRITRPAAWDLRRIQEQVVGDGDAVLLEYLLGADKGYVWAVTREGIEAYELPPPALIKEAAGKVYASLARRPEAGAADESLPAARELSRMILSPVAAKLNKSRIIIVADGILNYIPFQALPAPWLGDEPLIANYEVVNAPSASILGELQQEALERRPTAKVLAAFGDPIFASDHAFNVAAEGTQNLIATRATEAGPLQYALRDIELNEDTFDSSVIRRLFYAKRELAYLRDLAAGGETFVAADYNATRQTLLSANLTQYAILHFATHGILDPKRPERSGLVLSMIGSDGQALDGFVGLQDIYALRAPVNLVVLSACRTGLGKDVRGEGLLGLTRGFMYAGASSVMASLWKVDDEATSELMRQFYNNLLLGEMPPAEALRAAQNSIRQKPQWRSPYYWAAFTLQGEYRRVIRTEPAASFTALHLTTLAGGALLTLLTAAVWYRRRGSRRGREAGNYSTTNK